MRMVYKWGNNGTVEVGSLQAQNNDSIKSYDKNKVVGELFCFLFFASSSILQVDF